MGIQKRSPLSPSPAFTLVELIVVIAVIAALAALVVLLFPRLQDSQRVAKGADVLQGQLFLAKQMAARDQLPRGVRLIQGPNAGQYTSVQLIEQPLSYAVGQATGAANPSTYMASGYDVKFNTTQQPAPNFGNNTVQVGDYLDLSPALDSYTLGTYPRAMHVITAVNFNNMTSDWVLTIATQPSSTLYGVSATNATMPGQPWNYRVVRSARAMVAQQPVSLPEDVAITLPTGSATDILFDPSGVVLGSGPGKFVYLLQDPTGGTPEQTLVAVFSRAGNIMAQPIAPGADPYLYIKDGSTSGM
jgi:prepilin-type N-terminal cleavage/methylation domain-containing protein